MKLTEFHRYDYITVSEDRAKYLYKIAQEQEEKGTADSRDFDKENYTDANHTGLFGEWAFSQYYGVEFDPTIGNADGGRDYEIFYTPKDQQVLMEVKCRRPGDNYLPDLEVRTHREVSADLYLLTEKRGLDIGFIGLATAQEVKDARVYPSDVLSPNEVRCVFRNDLHDPPSPGDIEDT